MYLHCAQPARTPWNAVAVMCRGVQVGLAVSKGAFTRVPQVDQRG